MKAIVLSGGGSKGSYQIGVWKALKKLHIKYDIVTGASVGALNGAFMVQNRFLKAKKLWKKINMELLFGNNVATTNKDILKMYETNFIKHGGMKVDRLEQLINNSIDSKKFYNSKINFGLVTVNISHKKAIQLEKKDIPPNKLTDYLMASASCYPAFQTKNIDGKKFIDGGFFDNLPINLAINLGADEIIAIDLCAPGLKKRIKDKSNVTITTIKPNNKLTNFLIFNEEGSIRNMKYGYNDTMKKFNKFFGNKYTFKNKNFSDLLEEYNVLYIHNFNRILNTEKLLKRFEVEKLNIDNLILDILENLGHLFNFDETKIYNIKKYNKKLLKISNNLIYADEKLTKKQEIVINLYKKMKKKDYKEVRIKGILTIKEFFMALYLYTLSEE